MKSFVSLSLSPTPLQCLKQTSIFLKMNMHWQTNTQKKKILFDATHRIFCIDPLYCRLAPQTASVCISFCSLRTWAQCSVVPASHYVRNGTVKKTLHWMTTSRQEDLFIGLSWNERGSAASHFPPHSFCHPEKGCRWLESLKKILTSDQVYPPRILFICSLDTGVPLGRVWQAGA